jgi:serine/threonine protein kinase
MKYLPGIPEQHTPLKTRRLTEYASFCALRDCHRKGIAHMDPHEGNFLYDKITNHAVAIDFGLAQDHSLFREFRDLYIFSNLRKITGHATLFYLIDFYCKELKEYILAHRYQTAKTFVIYAAVIGAALCGASTLGMVSILAQTLINAMLLQRVSELLEALQEHCELRAWNQHKPSAYRHIHFGLAGLLVLLQGLLVALQVQSLQNCFGTIDALIELIPWMHTVQYWFNNMEKYLFTGSLTTAIYQHKISLTTQQMTFLPLFKAKTATTPKALATILHSPSQSPQLKKHLL